MLLDSEESNDPAREGLLKCPLVHKQSHEGRKKLGCLESGSECPGQEWQNSRSNEGSWKNKG